jgi:tetratricopeptide (TPR) repeat protein
MGLFDFLFGGGKDKLGKLIEKKQFAEISRYLKDEDESVRKRAMDALVAMVKGHQLSPGDEKALMGLLDQFFPLSRQMRVDEMTDPYEIRKIAVNEYFQKGEFAAAIYALERALTLKPGDTSFQNNLAAAYSLKGDFEKARDIWEEILKNKPGDSTAVENYSTALQMRSRKLLERDGNSPEAEELLRRVMDLNPSHINSLSTLGEYNLNQGEYQKAIQNFKECLKSSVTASGFSSLSEFKASINRKIALCYSGMDEKAEAILYYKEALKIHNWVDFEKGLIEDSIRDLQGLPRLSQEEESPAAGAPSED